MTPSDTAIQIIRDLAAQGHTARQIARVLGLAPGADWTINRFLTGRTGTLSRWFALRVIAGHERLDQIGAPPSIWAAPADIERAQQIVRGMRDRNMSIAAIMRACGLADHARPVIGKLQRGEGTRIRRGTITAIILAGDAASVPLRPDPVKREPKKTTPKRPKPVQAAGHLLPKKPRKAKVEAEPVAPPAPEPPAITAPTMMERLRAKRAQERKEQTA